ncbi:diguanylate cyclase [Thiospirochaeta perfilievii]|uniref:diguanylate cyclase n=1 Tax=Thiospirochaeta perfilievii TaxID=252967 RepID=A0A5C1QAQ7_9SPIO|nr:GGDEF domain-containing protein [Thiospirochaeta perfilievii]QEN04428.1 diguanylate cyclase [Thiospirochaeta perfilievii]
MDRKEESYSIREQIFLMFMPFCTLISIISLLTNKNDIRSNVLFIIAIAYFTTLTYLSYKKVSIPIIHRLGIYVLIFLILPVLWLREVEYFPLNITYTILIFMLLNYLTVGKERITLNILGITLLESLLLIFHDKIQTTTPWIILFPLVFLFLALLLITIERAYEIEKLNTQEREDKLTKLTRIDHLTGLYNRNYMEQKLKSVHNIWKRGVQTYSLIMLDIDYFKDYNDYYGHIKGDNCLKIISSILQEQITRDTDYAFRYGGEEFLIILGFTDVYGAEFVANKIKAAIDVAKIEHNSSKISNYITISMGISTINETYNSFSDLLLMTDKALYQAKNSGRNRVIHYKEDSLVTT